MDLIKNATDLMRNKLSGIKLTDQHSVSLTRLKSQCIQKVEEKCVQMVTQYLEDQIIVSDNELNFEVNAKIEH